MRPLSTLLIVLATCTAALPAWGHLLNMTEARLTVDEDGRVDLGLHIDLLRSTDSPAAYHALATDPYDPAYAELWQRLADGIVLKQGEQRIPLTVTRINAVDDRTLADFENPLVWPRMRVRLAGGPVDLAASEPLSATFTAAFVFEEPVALTMSEEISGTRKSRWLVTDQPSPAFDLTGKALPEASFDPLIVLDAARQGVLHILPGGFDHLLFLLALVLTIRRTKDLVITVTLFTIAHSVTLALAAMRIVEVPSMLVELAILASIAWVAAQALLDKPLRHGYVVIGLFGLMHGLGFATAFRAVTGHDALLWRLFGFNVGIEVAQLAFVLFALGTLSVVRRHIRDSRRVVRPIAALVLAMPCFWALRILLV